jgi:peptidoglycan/LPS O-acetylase OafA/YrhL
LDAVRGIAALVVLIYHCLLTLPIWSDVVLHGTYRTKLAAVLGRPPLSLPWDGSAAVDVFFALSGFVLALMFLRPDPPSYGAFVTKRICRIYLPYIAVVSIAMVLMTATAPHQTPELSEWFRYSWRGPVSIGLILDHALMLGRPKFNFVDNPIWSLVHEMRYSLLFPLIMRLVNRFSWLPVLACSLVSSAAAIWAFSRIDYNPAVDSLQYAFLFVAGAVLAAHRDAVKSWFRKRSPALRLVLLIVSLLLLSRAGARSPFALVRNLLIAGPEIGSVLLLSTVIGSARMHTALENKPLLWLGRISYSLYLSHVVLLMTLGNLLHRIVPISWILIAMFPLALILADALYRFLERPSIGLGHRLANRIEVRRLPTWESPANTPQSDPCRAN